MNQPGNGEIKIEKSDKKTILIIEDDVFLIKNYQFKFTKEGFNVITVSDGKKVQPLIDKTPPDLVLLDLMLPEVSGFDLLEMIKKSPKWKSVPVIVMSNLGQPEDIERGKKLGASDYLIKSNVRINEVVDKVKEYLK